MDFITNNAGALFLLIGVLWIAQFGMAYLQMRRFYGRLKEVRKGGLTAVGLGGGQYKGRSYAVLTVNDKGRVVHAEQFDGWTVFARLKAVPDIIGMRVEDVIANPDQLPVSSKLQRAFANAARDIQTAREKGANKVQAQPA